MVLRSTILPSSMVTRIWSRHASANSQPGGMMMMPESQRRFITDADRCSVPASTAAVYRRYTMTEAEHQRSGRVERWRWRRSDTPRSPRCRTGEARDVVWSWAYSEALAMRACARGHMGSVVLDIGGERRASCCPRPLRRGAGEGDGAHPVRQWSARLPGGVVEARDEVGEIDLPDPERRRCRWSGCFRPSNGTPTAPGRTAQVAKRNRRSPAQRASVTARRRRASVLDLDLEVEEGESVHRSTRGQGVHQQAEAGAPALQEVVRGERRRGKTSARQRRARRQCRHKSHRDKSDVHDRGRS